MLVRELEHNKLVRVKETHPSRPLRGAGGFIEDFRRQPSGWIAVRVDLPGIGRRTFHPAQLEAT